MIIKHKTGGYKMYGLETLDAMNNKEMDRYHKEQRRKKDAIKSIINDGITEFFGKRHYFTSDLRQHLNKIIDNANLDLENQESL